SQSTGTRARVARWMTHDVSLLTAPTVGPILPVAGRTRAAYGEGAGTTARSAVVSGQEALTMILGRNALPISVIFLLACTGVAAAAEDKKKDEKKKEAPKIPDHKEGEYNWRIGPQCKLDHVTGGWWFNLGPTGIRAKIDIDRPTAFKVKYIFPDSPGHGKVKPGEYIVGVNGKLFQTPDPFCKGSRVSFGYSGPRWDLGEAIEESEGDPKLKGKLTFMVERDGKTVDVVVQLRQLGRFSPTFPYKCRKSEILITQACEFLLRHQRGNGGWPGHVDSQVTPVLALMAQGEKYMPAVQKHFAKMSGSGGADVKPPVGGWTWAWGMRGIAEAEYYLASGDKRALDHLGDIDAWLSIAQDPKGGYHHHPYKSTGMGYGQMAFPTGLATTAWALMKRCGMKINEAKYLNSRRRLNFSTSPTGSIGYGLNLKDIPARLEIKKGDPRTGRPSRLCGATAMATLMHYIDPMDDYSEYYYKRGVERIAYSRELFPDGHAAGALHTIWCWTTVGLGPVLDDMTSYRETLDHFKFWLNVNRCHDQSFYFPPNRDVNVDPFRDIRFNITGGAILLLSAPKRKLHILGKDPLIPGVDLSTLSRYGRGAYDLVKGKKYADGLKLIARLEKRGKSDEQEVTALALLRNGKRRTSRWRPRARPSPRSSSVWPSAPRARPTRPPRVRPRASCSSPTGGSPSTRTSRGSGSP
ncbi:MAG: DUF6288 domain-containing protein, partial [Planctomycetota bacterium]